MKKIPTLFKRVFGNHQVIDIKDEITPGCEEAFLHGIATIKIDGACCAIFGGELYKRYDAKNGKKPPEGAIPCCEPDPVTGHWPHWVKADPNKPEDKWFFAAFCNTPGCLVDGESVLYLPNGTYEAIGKHFNSNPYGLCDDILEPHGVKKVDVERTFDGIKKYLEENYIEGLVFWLNDEPVCKIKRTDFGLPWPVKK